MLSPANTLLLPLLHVFRGPAPHQVGRCSPDSKQIIQLFEAEACALGLLVLAFTERQQLAC